MLLENITKVKEASKSLIALNEEEKNKFLFSLSQQILSQTEKIISANKIDLAKMTETNPLYDRLLLDEKRIQALTDDLVKVANLPNPIGEILQKNIMANGLVIQKIAVPLGVVAVIYESRPNVTMDVFSLCFKTGNACILKGGKEALHTNQMLVSIIQDFLIQNHINPDIIALFSLEREETKVLLKAQYLIDVCIPRGSKQLIDFVREEARIPVIETGAGVVHVYFDRSGDVQKGRAIIHNAKTRRVSVCNALDCLIIHHDRLRALAELVEPLIAHEVIIYADQAAYDSLQRVYPSSLLYLAKPNDFGQEFLAYKMAIKTVHSIESAVTEIARYTSGHSEAIVTEDEQVAAYFLKSIDAAVVYVNASTAFTDGGEFGMGAEIGISTQKLHARGPMGLQALTSYKWVVRGEGQVR